MGNTDFIDNDLIQRRDKVREVRIGPGQDAAPMPEIPKSGPVPVEELNLTPLARRKEEINSKVATKLDELERLRSRQDALEKEKAALESLRDSQEKYEAGKREMIDRLEKSIIAMEREDVSLNQRLALVSDTTKSFKEMLKELRAFNEENWPVDSNGLRDELNRTLAVIDNIRKEYNQACARLDAVRETRAQEALGNQMAVGDVGIADARRGFGEWLKIGFAVSLPLIITLVVFMLVLIMRQTGY